jgi:serine/threonine protein kinase
MRLADTTLSELAKALNAQKMRFTEPVALFYAIGVLEACQEMHLADFIHADIKPDNLCVSYGDLTRVGAGPSVDAIAAAVYNVTLIDYSISVDLRSFDKDQRFLANEGSPCQVKEYSWPPALKGASWRREVDLYGLGCILYQMVVSAIQPKGIDMTVTTLEKRIPRPGFKSAGERKVRSTSCFNS